MEQIDINGVLPTNEWLWRSVEHSFRRQYADTLAKERAQAELKKGLKWTRDVDVYVTKFEQLVRAAGYEIDGDLTIDMFTAPLPRALYEKIFQDDHPTTYKQWKECIIMRHQQWIHMQAHMGRY